MPGESEATTEETANEPTLDFTGGRGGNRGNEFSADHADKHGFSPSETRNSKRGTRNPEPGTRNLILGPRNARKGTEDERGIFTRE